MSLVHQTKLCLSASSAPRHNKTARSRQRLRLLALQRRI